MTDLLKAALVGAIGPTIAAIASLWVSLKNSDKLIEIHTLTNSNLSKVTSALEVANTKIEGLQKLLTKKD